MAVDDVGMIAIDQLLDDVLHLVDVFSGTRAVLRMLNIQPIHLIDVSLGIGLDDGSLGGAFFGRTLDDLVIDVGDVGHHGYFEAAPPQEAGNDVVGEGGASVTQVRNVVDGGPAGVDRHLAWFARNEVDHFIAKGVEVLHGQRG